MNAVLDKNVQRKVKSLKVRCSDYKEGCEWVGELKDLHNHFDPAIGGCGTTCPFGCGKYAQRSEIREHTHHCHKRMISCENCGYYNTFTIVTKKHYPMCPKIPVDCPNHCPVKDLRSNELQQHLNIIRWRPLCALAARQARVRAVLAQKPVNSVLTVCLVVRVVA